MSFASRRKLAVRSVPDDLPGLLVTTAANVRYLTGFTGSNGQLWLGEDCLFLTDGRYTEQSAAQVADLERAIYTQGAKMSDMLGNALADRGVDRVGVEADHLTLAAKDRLSQGLAGIELVPTSGVIEGVRRCKDAGEITAIRKAQELAEEVLRSVLSSFEGGTEAELALSIEWELRTRGAEGVSFDVIVASGAHSALPHAMPRGEPVNLDGVLLIDMGARVDGYCSDMTRTFLGPKAPDEMVHAHQAVLKALDAACKAVAPGKPCVDIDRAAREVLETEGLAEAFVHSTGHGVGMEIHEAPTLGTSSEEDLAVGDVVTVEPGAYLPGVGGVRIEDLLVVTEDGCEILTRFDRGPELPR